RLVCTTRVSRAAGNVRRRSRSFANGHYLVRAWRLVDHPVPAGGRATHVVDVQADGASFAVVTTLARTPTSFPEFGTDRIPSAGAVAFEYTSRDYRTCSGRAR